MIDYYIYVHIIFSFLATLGFAIFLKSPRNTAVPSAIVGTIGWVVYVILMRFKLESTLCNFMAAVSVSMLSEILARRLKQPTTLFVLPGIIPLIPGLGLYNTVFYLGQKDFTEAISTGTTTIFASGAIALGVLIVSSLFRTINIIEYRQKLKNKKLKI